METSDPELLGQSGSVSQPFIDQSATTDESPGSITFGTVDGVSLQLDSDPPAFDDLYPKTTDSLFGASIGEDEQQLKASNSDLDLDLDLDLSLLYPLDG